MKRAAGVFPIRGSNFAPLSNLIVTGIPRSGTTLTAAIIDGMEDAVCINEPQWQSAWSRQGHDRATYVKRIRDDFGHTRATLLAGGSILTRVSPEGTDVTNFFDQSAPVRKRRPLTFAPMSRPGLQTNFLLAMKHNAHYACVLEELASLPDFAVLAVIRNPVDTLLSWRSLNIPVSSGSMPAAEPFWPEITEARGDTQDVLLVQARIVELFFRRFHALREKIAILRLEDLIDNPQSLNHLLDRRQRKHVPITPSRLATSAPAAETDRLRNYVAAHCPTAMNYYPAPG